MKPIYNDERNPDIKTINVLTMEDQKLAHLGLSLKEVDRYDPDTLIKLFEMTFKYVRPNDYDKIHDYIFGPTDPIKRQKIMKLRDIWDIRNCIAHRMPEILV